jgi:hypothetical protein
MRSQPPAQVDLTFTAEGTDAAPHTLSLRGLDHSSFYRANGVLNCGQPATQQYLLDVLRHWAGVRRRLPQGRCLSSALLGSGDPGCLAWRA